MCFAALPHSFIRAWALSDEDVLDTLAPAQGGPCYDVNLLQSSQSRTASSHARVARAHGTRDPHAKRRLDPAEAEAAAAAAGGGGHGRVAYPAGENLVPPQMMVESCLQVPLDYQMRAVNTAITDYFINDLKLVRTSPPPWPDHGFA